MTIYLRKEDFFKPANSPIAMARRRPQWPFEIHTHEFSELVIILNGHGVHVTENETYPLTKGDVFFISGHRSHGFEKLDNLNLINIYYDPKEVDIPTKDLYTLPGYQALFTLEPAYRKQHRFKSRLQLSDKELTHVLGLIDKLDDELRKKRSGFRFMVCAIFMQVVGYISRCYEQSPNPASQELLNIGKAISHIENCYEQPITIEELAGLAHMSKRNFSRIFKKAMGDSPINYLLKLRLTKAAELLRQHRMNVTQVAYHVGFQDSNYFARQFRQVFGINPKRYREQKNHLPFVERVV